MKEAPRQNTDEGVRPAKELDITPEPELDTRGRSHDALGEPAEEEDPGGSE